VKIFTGQFLYGLSWKTLLRRAWHEFVNDNVLDQSAMLSFYFLLALFPLLLLLIPVVGFFLNSRAALQDAMHHYIHTVVPPPATMLIDRTLEETRQQPGTFRYPFALLFLWWSASQGVVATIQGLNTAYGVRERRSWGRRYLLASLLTVIFMLLITFGLVLLTYGGELSRFLADHFGFSTVIGVLWQIAEWVIFLALAFIVFNIFYVFAPNLKHQQWSWLMPGTVVAVCMWLTVSFGFKVYLLYFNSYSMVYGSIGAVIILLLWFYFLGISILFGAEINSEIEKAAGNVDRSGKAGPADPA
jgi:membrane protein